MLSEQPELIEQHWPQIEEAILRFNYDKLHYSAFFYVENVIYDRTRNGEKTKKTPR